MKGTHIYQTQRVYNTCQSDWEFYKEVIKALSRFLTNDWGDTCKSDKELNDYAVKYRNDRIVAKYITSKGELFIIKESNCTTSTILFADEY